MGKIIVSIDIGSSKVCAIIGKISDYNTVQILGKGMDICNGVKKGIIVDIDATSRSVKNAVERAEEMANLKVFSAFVNISATHVDIIKSRNSIVIGNESREITPKDVEKVLYSSMDFDLPEGREIVGVIPEQFTVDGCDGIVDPVGMTGSRLEADVNIIAGKVTSIQNIIKSLERAGIKTEDLIVEGFATAHVALTPEEKEIGVVLLDIGGGTTDISVFRNKNLVYYGAIPVGGDHITNDIAIGLKIPFSEAEKIKRQYELALTSLIKNDQEISVTDLNDERKEIKVSEFVEIIEARVYEIFSLAREQIEKNGIDSSKYDGVVLTGAGISYIDGSTHLAREVFEKPVRVASIKLGEPLKCEYAAAAGIVKYIAAHNRENTAGNAVKPLKSNADRKESKGFLKKLFRFLHSLF